MPVRVPIAVASEIDDAHGIDARAARDVVRAAVRAALKDRNVKEAEISVTLLDDAGITEINGEYLERDRATDVISFPLYEEGEAPFGDVYIGLEQALRQAKALGVHPLQELARLAVHATLHVLGYDHPESADRERSEMWQVQERIVRDLGDRWPPRAR